MDPTLSRPFWLSPLDATGSPRSSVMIDAAAQVWGSVLIYTKDALGETEPAAEFLERTIRSVERSQKKHEIRDLRAYIFRSYVRVVAAERRRRRRLLPFDASGPGPVRPARAIELRVLAQQALAMIRPEILPLVFRRMEGWTWKEIASQLGEPQHLLESRYSYEMRRIRNLLRTRKP